MDHPTQRLDPNAPDLPGRDMAVCPRCSGNRVWAKTQAYGPPLFIYKLPRKLFGQQVSECVPLVCTTCGYTEFYTQNPQKLAE